MRHEVVNAVRDFFNGRGFIMCDTPIFTPAACEGTSTLFPVSISTQHGVPHPERSALQRSQRVALGKVYCFGPTFRAEKSKTGVTSPSSGWSSPRWLCHVGGCDRARRGAHHVSRGARAGHSA